MKPDLFVVGVSMFAAFMFFLGLVAGLVVSALVCGLPAGLERLWHLDAAQILGHGAGPKCAQKQELSLLPDQVNLRFISTVVATGLLWGWAALHYGLSPEVMAAFVLGSGLLTVSLIDHDHQLLPDVLVLPLMWLGLIANSFELFTPLHNAFWGAVIGYVVLWSVRELSKLITGYYGMGQGDLKLLSMLGAWGGWQILPGTMLMSLLTSVVVSGMFVASGKIDRTTPMPFGPYLAAAGWLSLLYTPDWVSM